jgi:hypothetical protein
MKQLGLKFRGAKAWPQFRSFRPGCFPWYIEKPEAEMLACALEQLLDVAPRYKKNFGIFPPADKDDYLVRVNHNGTWEDSTMHIENRAEREIRLAVSTTIVDALKKQMPGKATIETDFFMLSNPVQDNREERPFFPYMLMVCDQASQMILATELLKPLPTLEAMWGEIPQKVMETLVGRFAPKEIQVNSDLMRSVLEPVAGKVGFKVKKVSRLPAINSARKELGRFF